MCLNLPPHTSALALRRSFTPLLTAWRPFFLALLLVGVMGTLTSLLGYSGIALSQTSVLGDLPQAMAQTENQPTDMTGCGGDILPSSNPDFEARVVQLVNQIRLEHGLLPFKRVTSLENAGRFHATDMAVDDYFSHTSHDRVNGQLVEVCAWSDRIQTYYKNYNILAENIAAGFSSPEAVVDGWMNSPGHRNNILNGENWEIGVGYFTSVGGYRHYWVQDLGRTRDVYPVVIDGDAQSTDTGDLTLHIYGDWQTARFRTNEGPWSEWQPFQPALSQRIEGDAGLYTVYAELRKDDQTVTSSASIYLTQSNRPAQLSTLPDQIDFVYLRSRQRFTPDLISVHPLAIVGEGYRWSATVDGNWLMVTPPQGDEAVQAEIYPSVASAVDLAPGTASVVFSLLNAEGDVVDSHTVTVSLQVIDDASSQIYLPSIQNQ